MMMKRSFGSQESPEYGSAAKKLKTQDTSNDLEQSAMGEESTK